MVKALKSYHPPLLPKDTIDQVIIRPHSPGQVISQWYDQLIKVVIQRGYIPLFFQFFFLLVSFCFLDSMTIQMFSLCICFVNAKQYWLMHFFWHLVHQTSCSRNSWQFLPCFPPPFLLFSRIFCLLQSKPYQQHLHYFSCLYFFKNISLHIFIGS